MCYAKLPEDFANFSLQRTVNAISEKPQTFIPTKITCYTVYRYNIFNSFPCRLLAHVFDPELDQPNPRDYVVYAVPGGALGRQIGDFMESAQYSTGRNGAHKSSPHVTLCQFFKVGVANSIWAWSVGVVNSSC